ncbi:MBL fold metallo-hydrolase [Ornithinibacillus gellani]|uniref:MBL fold metallo-hydrolase n=1 Tax=Ornithinibacillus gellani TaxID=2293253 RepID=UPI000F463425|nr:MBL fold metallo-hydrolase [Ornithinibacillus gellani]TQS74542.1 MBL fold metallo-hydrolase [Ornithinibacillus gellani]
MKIIQKPLGPLGTNCYLLSQHQEALIIDPGGDADQVIEYLESNQLKPLAILLTHAHYDHIGAVGDLRKHYGLDVYLHANEKDWLMSPELNRSLYFDGVGYTTESPEQLILPGQMKLGSFQFEVLHTPGHSPGSVSFVFKAEQFVVSGDVLFQQGIGRTDLPGGDTQVLVDSIRQKLYKLSDETIVYPGHGAATTIHAEKKQNPFVPEN